MTRPIQNLAVLALLGLSAALPVPETARAQETSPLVMLQGQDQGWDAVGRLNLGIGGFCTGVLIAPDQVLTAAHCLFDRETRTRLDPRTIEFLPGWRNGYAAAYGNVRRAVVHPSFVYSGSDQLGRVAFDLALLELERPVDLPARQPFHSFAVPPIASRVGVVSYAIGRAEAPSLQQSCEVLDERDGILVLSCAVDFGASGAPVFTTDAEGRVKDIVSVVSSKAQIEGRKVALGPPVARQLAALRLELDRSRSDAGAR